MLDVYFIILKDNIILNINCLNNQPKALFLLLHVPNSRFLSRIDIYFECFVDSLKSLSCYSNHNLIQMRVLSFLALAFLISILGYASSLTCNENSAE